MKPRLLDLFCGAGGCSVGYDRAGFDVEGVDKEPHPDYPFPFHQADALTVLEELVATGAVFGGWRPDVVHASPPCPLYSLVTPAATRADHPDLVGPVRDALIAWGGTYVIENVEGAPLASSSDLFGAHGVLLCGSMFGLGARCRDGEWRYLKRHRLFESSAGLYVPSGCRHRGQAVGVYGDGGGGPSTRPSGGGGYKAYPEEARAAMGIDWMRRDDLADAIPPAYTEFIGAQILERMATPPASWETEGAA